MKGGSSSLGLPEHDGLDRPHLKAVSTPLPRCARVRTRFARTRGNYEEAAPKRGRRANEWQGMIQ
jgi:hypothetical protein